MSTCSELRFLIEHLPNDGLVAVGEVPFSSLDVADEERIICAQPLAFRLHIAPVHGGILVQGHLSTVLRCRCDRCLHYYDLPVSTDEVCHLREGTREKVIDLTEDVREDILMTFPFGSLCREDCRGLCPACGQNLNVRQCACATTSATGGTWQALDALALPTASNAAPEHDEE